MKILITGASGFVGQNLTQYLISRSIEIKPLSLRGENWQSDFDKKADVVVHLAGKAHDTTNASRPEEYFKINRDLTVELFDLFLKSGIRDFFYFSSVKAVADTVEDVLTENVKERPFTHYGKSKFEAEQYLQSKLIPEGKRLFIIRPCMIHGPGNKGNLNLLYKLVKKGIPWPLSAFKNRRSFLSIDNLSFLTTSMLLDKNVSGGVYHFADDKALSTTELVTLISRTLGKKPKLWYINKNIIEKIALTGDRIKLPLNSERLRKLTEDYIVSNQKIKTALGIEKLPLSAEEGLKITFQSFKKAK